MKSFVLIIWTCISIILFALGTDTIATIVIGINGVVFLFWLTHKTTPVRDKEIRSKHSNNNIHGPQV